MRACRVEAMSLMSSGGMNEAALDKQDEDKVQNASTEHQDEIGPYTCIMHHSSFTASEHQEGRIKRKEVGREKGSGSKDETVPHNNH